MSALIISAIAIAILSGIWGFISIKLGLITWIGFIGCTSYYAAVNQDKGLKDSLISNFMGIVLGVGIIITSKFLGNSLLISSIIIAIFSFIMVAQAKFKLLSYIPGTFLGCSCVFGANGDWKGTILAMIIGGIFVGYISHISGNYLYKLISSKK